MRKENEQGYIDIIYHNETYGNIDWEFHQVP